MSSSEIDHREFLYSAVAWVLMDLRQDIEFAYMWGPEPYPVDKIIQRLALLQNETGNYADKYFPYGTAKKDGDF